MEGKDLYVLFDYTASLIYAVGKAIKHDIVSLSDRENEEVIKALNLSGIIPNSFNCTAYGDKACLAFFIEEFIPIYETIDKNWIMDNFDGVVLDNNSQKVKAKVSNECFKAVSRSTYFLKQKLNAKINTIPTELQNMKGRFTFFGKLKYPYIIRLECANE